MSDNDTDREFERWLRTKPSIRELIADSNNPAHAKAAFRLAYAVGFVQGYKEGTLNTIGVMLA